MSILTKKNERSWAIQLIKIVENYCKKNNYAIKKVGGEETISNKKRKMFPDVLLFADEKSSVILQGWELKMPDISISDTDFIHDSWRKADALGLNSTFIWNFRCGVLYIKNEISKNFEEIHRWDISDKISNDRNDVYLFQEIWEPVLYEAVDAINHYLINKKYREISIGEAISSTIIEKIINDNKNLVADYLKAQQKTNLVLNNYLLIWWDDVKNEYSKDEIDKDAAYAKVILLNWITKFLIAHLIRKKSPEAEIVTTINEKNTPEEVLKIFETITNKCDFYSIFHPLDYQELIPSDTWNTILELHNFLKDNGLNILNQEDFQLILENTTAISNRLIIGQFTTPRKLAEFMVKSVIVDANAICIDTCCGSGTIPKEIIKYKYSVLKEYEKSYQTTLASDKFSFPLQIANVSLTSENTINIPCRLFQKDVFNLNSGDVIDIVNPKDGSIINMKISDISYVISNLPFIDFNKNNKNIIERERIATKIINDVKENTGIEIDNRSDYSFFIIFHLWNILKKSGKACLVISNSWMGTESGTKFLNALRYYYHINSIYISSAERWFKNAKIVTTILILEKKDIEKENDNYVTHYFRLNKKLKDFTEKDMNKAVYSSLTFKEIDDAVISFKKHSLKELENTCIHFNLCRNIGFIDFSWINDFKDKIQPLSEFFDCFPGIKSGDDSLFYDSARNNIDKIYYSPMLKNTKNCKSYITEADDFVINCSKSYDELEKLGHYKTIEYFKSKENNLNQSTKGHGKIWWKIPQIENKASLFTALAPNKRIFFGKLKNASVINQRVVGYYPLSQAVDVDLFHALLNSIFSIFIVEAMGFGRGDGVLDLNRTKLSNMKVLNPTLLSESAKNNIKKSFLALCQREICDDLENELEMEDRKEFDLLVLRELGLEKYYKEIKNSLLSLYKIRFSVKN